MTAPLDRPTTVAVLHIGEMGAAVASLLLAGGCRVVTHLEGASDATVARCRAVGCEVLAPAAMFAAADVVISLVTPDAAGLIAKRFAASAARPGTLFVEANSIGPDLAADLARHVEAAGHAFVDAAINGLAANLTTTATLFLSGRRAGDVAALFAARVKVQRLGDEPGRASAMKMLLAGIAKGTCALYTELALVAAAHGLSAEFAANVAAIYPSIGTLAERMLPTYTLHAARRSVEMAELLTTAESAGVDASVVAAVREHHAALAHHLAHRPARRSISFADYLRHLADTDFAAAAVRRPDASINSGDVHG